MDAATELANELQRLHTAYQRLVEENNGLKKSQAEGTRIMAENASLRAKLRSKEEQPPIVIAAPQSRPLVSQTVVNVRPERGMNRVEPSHQPERSSRAETAVLSRQLRDAKDRLQVSEDKVREREGEITRLRTELGRAPRSDAIEAALASTVGRAVDAASGGSAAAADEPARWQLSAWLEGLELPSLLCERLSARYLLDRSPKKRLVLDDHPARAEATLSELDKAFMREVGAMAASGGSMAAEAHALVASLLKAGADLPAALATQICAKAARLHLQSETRSQTLAERAARSRPLDGTAAAAEAMTAEAMAAEAMAAEERAAVVRVAVEEAAAPAAAAPMADDDGGEAAAWDSAASVPPSAALGAGTGLLSRARPRKRYVPAAEFASQSLEREGCAAVLGSTSDFFDGLASLVGPLEAGVLTLDAMKVRAFHGLPLAFHGLPLSLHSPSTHLPLTFHGLRRCSPSGSPSCPTWGWPSPSACRCPSCCSSRASRRSAWRSPLAGRWPWASWPRTSSNHS